MQRPVNSFEGFKILVVEDSRTQAIALKYILEQEGFGIVFLEAAACGVAQIAGDSGGAAEAVADGETGLVVRDPEDVQEVGDAIARLLDDDALRASMAVRSRARVLEEFSYDVLARRLGETLGVYD